MKNSHLFLPLAALSAALLVFTALFVWAQSAELSDRELRMLSAVHGFDHGYMDGYEQGKKDAASGLRFEFAQHRAYREAMRGFEERFVYRVAFQQGYRKGFERGYSDGFNGKEGLFASRFIELEGDNSEPVAQRQPGGRSEPPRASRPSSTVRVPEGTTLRIKLNDALSTKTNARGDAFSAQVTQPVFVGTDMVIPVGSTVRGTVASVEKAGRVKGRSELNLRFESITLPNGHDEPIVATLIGIASDQEKETVESGEGTVKGEGSKKRDAAVIGAGAGIGAAIGAIAGGAKGTAIGAGAGGLIGLAGVLATRGKDIELPAGTELEIQLDRPLNLPPYR